MSQNEENRLLITKLYKIKNHTEIGLQFQKHRDLKTFLTRHPALNNTTVTRQHAHHPTLILRESTGAGTHGVYIAYGCLAFNLIGLRIDLQSFATKLNSTSHRITIQDTSIHTTIPADNQIHYQRGQYPRHHQNAQNNLPRRIRNVQQKKLKNRNKAIVGAVATSVLGAAGLSAGISLLVLGATLPGISIAAIVVSALLLITTVFPAIIAQRYKRATHRQNQPAFSDNRENRSCVGATFKR